MSQIQVLCPGIMFYVLEKFLELGSTSQKRSWIQSVGCRKGIRFRSIIPTILSLVLLKLHDLDPRSQKSSQIQGVCPKIVSRFNSKVLERSQIQVLVPRKDPRFRSYVLDLCPRSQKCPRCRFQVLDLGLSSQEMSQSQVLCPRFMSKVLEKAPELGDTPWKKYQVQVLSSRKCPRFRTQVLENVLDLGHRYSTRFQMLDLCPKEDLDLVSMSSI